MELYVKIIIGYQIVHKFLQVVYWKVETFTELLAYSKEQEDHAYISKLYSFINQVFKWTHALFIGYRLNTYKILIQVWMG